MGTGWRGRGSTRNCWSRSRRRTQNPVQHLPAPGWRRSHFGGASVRGRTSESLRLFLELLRHPPKKVGRRCWRPRRCAPSSPPRRAVTQPRCPRSPELGRRRETDAHLPAALAAAFSGPLPSFSRGRPLPVPSSWSLSAPNFPPLQEELSSQDQAGAGPRPDCPAPHRPPPPRSRKCLSAGTSLTSQGFDVKGHVPVRKRWVREGLETRGRKSSSAPSCGRRSHPARAARRHLGSRLLTARAALSNSLQSRPPTPGPAPGPRTGPPAAPPAPLSRGSLSPALAARATAVRGADPARAPPSSRPVPGPQGLLRGCRPTRTSHSPRSPAPGPCRERRPPPAPAPPPSPHSAVLTSA